MTARVVSDIEAECLLIALCNEAKTNAGEMWIKFAEAYRQKENDMNQGEPRRYEALRLATGLTIQFNAGSTTRPATVLRSEQVLGQESLYKMVGST